MSFNKIILMGHLGKDPELRYTPQGIPVCTVSVATTEKRKDKSGTNEGADITTWFRVTLWRGLAETASKYLKKGNMVYFEGRLSTQEWQDRQGVTRLSLEVAGTEMHFIGGPRSEMPSDSGNNMMPENIERTNFSGSPKEDRITDDDIPF